MLVQIYLCRNVGPGGATRRSACPVLLQSESSPLGLSERMWSRRVCWWSDCLPRLSHNLPVSVPPQQQESSPPRLPVSAPPTGLDEGLFFISLVLDFLAVGFSVCFGLRGGTLCLPTPPCWFSDYSIFYITFRINVLPLKIHFIIFLLFSTFSNFVICTLKGFCFYYINFMTIC